MARRKKEPPAPDIRALENTYTIVGELRGSEGVRKYMANRLDDGSEVVITVLSSPGGGANNELSHFAADVQLLSSLSHPGLARVIESRWLDAGELAVVTERVKGTTLAESLRTGERFSNPRTAAVLQEVWGVLDWARASGVVHRGVSPDNVYFEPGTQHVTVLLGPTPIPVEGVNDTHGDARTIGSLAWSMLTGKSFSFEDAAKPLDQLEPNLALRVVDATETMVHGARDNMQEPDVPTFIGIVAAGDVLKQAEVELAAMKEEYEEQHRIALAQCENHRAETERMASEQAALLANEREDFEQTMLAHREQLAAVHDQLRQQSAALEDRMAEFEQRRAEINRLRIEQQERIEEARRMREDAALSADAEIARGELQALRQERQDIRSIVGVGRSPSRPAPQYRRREAQPESNGRRRWAVPAAIAAAALLFAGVAGGVIYRDQMAEAARRIAAARPARTPPARAAAGTVVPGGIIPTPAAPTIVVDSIVTPPATATVPIDSPARRESTSRPRTIQPRSDAPARVAPPAVATPAPTTPAPDSIWIRTDSILREAERRSRPANPGADVGAPRQNQPRDTSVSNITPGMRRDSVVRRAVIIDTVRIGGTRIDSIRRGDNVIRPDSFGRIPPD